jgi:cytoskeleton protein RodZ
MSMTLQEIGCLLREERERQGKSIEEIMEATRISRRNIAAIEAGDEKDLPHPVYAKGFVRSYARVLGLDADEVADRLAATYAPEEEDEEESSSCRQTQSLPHVSTGSRKSPWLVIVAVIVLLILLGWLVWSVGSGTQEEASEDFPPASVEAPPAPAPPAAVPEPAIPEQGEGALESDLPVVPAANATQAQPALPEEQGEESVPSAMQEPAAEIPVEPVKEPNRIHITVKAGEQCWLQAQLDDGQIREAFIRDGQSVTFTFEDQGWVRLGNAGGVQVTFNGASVPFDGVEGQVKTLHFP